MRVLVVGGSGGVGSAILPYLAKRHELRVLDVRAPNHDVDWIEGSATEIAALDSALHGSDAFINLMMRSPQGSVSTNQTVTEIVENYETNTLALHLLLYTAQKLGVLRAVHTSTVSVHHGARSRFPAEELVPLDSPSVYGLTKALGEHICQYFASWFDMNIIGLRITGPRTREAFLRERSEPLQQNSLGNRIYVTDEEDLARAYLRALEATGTGKGRYDAFYIAGDEHEERFNLSKALRDLGWAPESQRLLSNETTSK
jgi:nucleoside-diphosphate-sugar epimerase